MGVLEKKIYTLVCENCGSAENSRVLDKGNPYSGSFWLPSANFSHFETSWQGGGETEPQLISVKCKKCNSVNIRVTTEYSM